MTSGAYSLAVRVPHKRGQDRPATVLPAYLILYAVLNAPCAAGRGLVCVASQWAGLKTLSYQFIVFSETAAGVPAGTMDPAVPRPTSENQAGLQEDHAEHRVHAIARRRRQGTTRDHYASAF